MKSEKPKPNGSATLRMLVGAPNWMAFCQQIESHSIKTDAANAHGLRWEFSRADKGAELVYTFRVTKESPRE